MHAVKNLMAKFQPFIAHSLDGHRMALWLAAGIKAGNLPQVMQHLGEHIVWAAWAQMPAAL